MGEVNTIGVDPAKNVFQVHGVDGSADVCFWLKADSFSRCQLRAQLSNCPDRDHHDGRHQNPRCRAAYPDPHRR